MPKPYIENGNLYTLHADPKYHYWKITDQKKEIECLRGILTELGKPELLENYIVRGR